MFSLSFSPVKILLCLHKALKNVGRHIHGPMALGSIGRTTIPVTLLIEKVNVK